ncbi:MAG: thioredoxin domain-containing protein [Bacteroidota bacterium]|nr:thioredoxin domain-containing protein [Bacteroidota bacterium]
MRNVFFGLLFFSFTVCRAQEVTNSKIDPDAFEKAIAGNNVQVLDVRTAAEFNTGHIKNALLADWTEQQQFMDRVRYMNKLRPIYIYCLVGGRSTAAAAWMRGNGFTSLIELNGGINAWKAASKPLDGKSNEPQMTLEQYLDTIPHNKTVLVDFGATWCPPCIIMNPVLEELQKDKDLKFELIKIDGGIHTDIMKALNLEPIPVFIIYKDGKEVWRKQGVLSKKELAKQLK